MKFSFMHVIMKHVSILDLDCCELVSVFITNTTLCSSVFLAFRGSLALLECDFPHKKKQLVVWSFHCGPPPFATGVQFQ